MAEYQETITTRGFVLKTPFDAKAPSLMQNP